LLRLENCIKITHKGTPQLLEENLAGMKKYIADNTLTPTTVAFIVTKREMADMQDAEYFEVDAYISISPNVV